MPKPHFSELLQRRRHELGLSIEQASRILKLREDVLVSFEEGDFERIPQSGYAQGMLSSYARYLGLNSREIVDLFQEELYHYVNGTSSHELRRRTRDTQTGRFISGYDVVNAEGSRPKAYVEYRGLLPTSGGPAGDMGAFATTSPSRPRRTMPMAGSGPSAASAYGQGGYSNGGTRGHSYNAAPQGSSYQQDDEQYRGSARRARNQRRRTTNNNDPASRLLSQRQQVTGAASNQMSRQYSTGRGGAAQGRGTRPQRTYRRDDVSTRRVVSGDYSDDMRYDDRARPYERASTITGRRSSRNIASTDRPNVRRRAPQSGYGSGSRGRQQGRRRQPQRQGLLGGVLGFFSDSRNATFAIIVILAMVLTGILVFAATSCVNAKTQTGSTSGQTVAVNSTDSSSSKSNSSSSTDSGSDSGSSSKSTTSVTGTATTTDAAATTDAATTTDGSATDAAATTMAQQATVVKVSVADGEYSWLEIACDGTSAVAESVTGPWEAEYTVTDSISIRAANPSKVSVTENGKKVDFTSKASGTGSLTIKGTPVTTTDETAAADGDAATSGATTGGTSTTSTQ